MNRQAMSFLTAIILLVVVICLSLFIVSGIIIGIGAREGTTPGELVSGLFEGRQAARPAALLPSPPPPAPAPPPSPTPFPILNPPPQPPTVQALPALQATEPLIVNTPPPTAVPATPLPTVSSDVQVETVIDSPIRPGSPFPERPATRLVIPAMGLDTPVIISPIVDQTWQVDHLGQEFVGHLEGTASPGDDSNVVLAGHVTIAHNVYGPFAGLGELQPGDPIILYVGEQPYTYIVDYHQLVERTEVSVAFPTDAGIVTLITCSNWNEDLGAYQQRLIVVGHLAEEGT